MRGPALLVLTGCMLLSSTVSVPACGATPAAGGEAGSLPGAGWDAPREGPGHARGNGFSDEFDTTTLDPSWSWLNSPESFDVSTTRSGHLHLVSKRNTNFGQSLDNGALLYQIVNGSYRIETSVSSTPQSNFEKAGIMVRQDANNWVALKYQEENGDRVEVTVKTGGAASDHLVPATADPMYLCLERDGSTFTSYYSVDGRNWTSSWSSSVVLNDTVSAGLLIADGSSNANYPADFDYIRFGPPNRAPVKNQAFPPLSFDEDGVLPLRILDYIYDPDGDELNFTVLDAAHVRGAVNNLTGDLELRGPSNWHGSEYVSIKATDPYGKWTMTQEKVTVVSVDDPPYLKTALPDISLPQAGHSSPLALAGHFFDNDSLWGGTDALSFSGNCSGPVTVDVSPSGNATFTAPLTFWGSVDASFTATDTTSLAATVPVKVTVFHVNQAPQVRGSPPDLFIQEDENATMDFSPVLWDPDGDPMVLKQSGTGRLGVSIDGLNVTFTPPPDASGFQERTSFIVQDDKGLGSETVTLGLTVLPVNDPPRIASYSPPGAVSVLENKSLEFTMDASDPESGANLNITWYLDGEAVSGSANVYVYRPGFTSAGDHVVKAEADDGDLTASVKWNVTVKNVNRQPTGVAIVAPAAEVSVKAGAPVQFEGTATDPDGEELTYRWIEGYRELGTGRTMTKVLAIGTHRVLLEVTDGIDVLRTTTITITVKANSDPSLSAIYPSSGQRFAKGRSVPFSAEAVDIDGDVLSYRWTDGGALVSTSANFTLFNLTVGEHRMRLEVSDGNATIGVPFTIVVIEPRATRGGTDLLLVAALAVVVMTGGSVVAAVLYGRMKPRQGA